MEIRGALEGVIPLGMHPRTSIMVVLQVGGGREEHDKPCAASGGAKRRAGWWQGGRKHVHGNNNRRRALARAGSVERSEVFGVRNVDMACRRL